MQFKNRQEICKYMQKYAVGNMHKYIITVYVYSLLCKYMQTHLQ